MIGMLFDLTEIFRHISWRNTVYLNRILGLRSVRCLSAFTFVIVIGLANANAADRVWHDKTGKVEIEGELFARNESTAVIESNDADKSLVSLPISELSDEDQAFLKESESKFHAEKAESGMKSWQLRNGKTLDGQVVDYVHHDYAIQRRRGKAYVNDRLYDQLPEGFQYVVNHLVLVTDKIECNDHEDFHHWLLKQHGRTRHVARDGVLMEFGNGDLHPVPFDVFAAKEQAVLQGGFDDWKKHHDDEAAQRRESLHLQTEAAAYQRNAEQQRRISLMSLQTQQYNAGLFDYWQVELIPANGGRSQWVIVPARTSAAASTIAVDQHPGYRSRAIARLWRRH